MFGENPFSDYKVLKEKEKKYFNEMYSMSFEENIEEGLLSGVSSFISSAVSALSKLLSLNFGQTQIVKLNIPQKLVEKKASGGSGASGDVNEASARFHLASLLRDGGLQVSQENVSQAKSDYIQTLKEYSKYKAKLSSKEEQKNIDYIIRAAADFGKTMAEQMLKEVVNITDIKLMRLNVISTASGAKGSSKHSLHNSTGDIALVAEKSNKDEFKDVLGFSLKSSAIKHWVNLGTGPTDKAGGKNGIFQFIENLCGNNWSSTNTVNLEEMIARNKSYMTVSEKELQTILACKEKIAEWKSLSKEQQQEETERLKNHFGLSKLSLANATYGNAVYCEMMKIPITKGMLTIRTQDLIEGIVANRLKEVDAEASLKYLVDIMELGKEDLRIYAALKPKGTQNNNKFRLIHSNPSAEFRQLVAEEAKNFTVEVSRVLDRKGNAAAGITLDFFHSGEKIFGVVFEAKVENFGLKFEVGDMSKYSSKVFEHYDLEHSYDVKGKEKKFLWSLET